MENAIIVLILAVIASACLWYLIRKKKSGAKCVGCPYANQCCDKKGKKCK